MNQRIIAAVLSVCLLLTSLPLQALAEALPETGAALEETTAMAEETTIAAE